MSKQRKEILSHLTQHGVISETEAIARYLITPSSLNKVINQLRGFGFTISKTDYNIDNEYDLLDSPVKN